MAGFKRIEGSDRGNVRRTISSLALAVGDLVAYDRANAKVIKATSSTSVEDVAGVVVEATTTANTEVLLQRVLPGDVYEVESANAGNATYNYQRMVLTDENTVNNTGTDSTADGAVFMQTGIKTGSNIVGEFVVSGQDRA